MKPDVCFRCFHGEMKNYRFVWQAAVQQFLWHGWLM